MDLLRALRIFVRVAETGSFSAVARENGASQSATTRLIGQLEDHFQIRLFHRTTRHLSLTEDGQDLLGQARNLLELADGMEATLGRQRASPTGLVRMGVSPALATLLVPRLPAVFERYKELAVELVVRERFDELVEDRLDLAVQRGQPRDSSVVTRAIGTFGRVLVAGPSYLERNGTPTQPEELAKHQCVIHETGPESARWRFTGPRGPIEVEVSGAFRVNNGDIAHRAALNGYGIALLPESQVVDDIRAARLYRVLPDYPSGREPVFVMYPSRRHLPPRTRVMIDFLVQVGHEEEARLKDAHLWGETETTWLL